MDDFEKYCDVGNFRKANNQYAIYFVRCPTIEDITF